MTFKVRSHHHLDAADVVEQGGHQNLCHIKRQRKLSKSDEEFRVKKKWSMPKKLLVIMILLFFVAFITPIALILMFTELLTEHVNQISHYVAKKSPFNACGWCDDIKVAEGAEFTHFEKWIDETGCLRVTITCGLEHGTEAILQWYNEDKNMGVSFMDRVGQSNIKRSLECNARGHYELFENGHRGINNMKLQELIASLF